MSSINKLDSINRFNTLHHEFKRIVATEYQARAHAVWGSNLGLLKNLHAHMYNALNEIPADHRLRSFNLFEDCERDISNLLMFQEEGKFEEPEGLRVIAFSENRFNEINSIIWEKVLSYLPSNCGPVSTTFNRAESAPESNVALHMIGCLNQEVTLLLKFIEDHLSLPEEEMEKVIEEIKNAFNLAITTYTLEGTVLTHENLGQIKWKIRKSLFSHLRPILNELSKTNIENLRLAFFNVQNNEIYCPYLIRTVRKVLASCRFEMQIAMRTPENFERNLDAPFLEKINYCLYQNNPILALALIRNEQQVKLTSLMVRDAYQDLALWLFSHNQWGEVLTLCIEESETHDILSILLNPIIEHLTQNSLSFTTSDFEQVVTLCQEDVSLGCEILNFLVKNYPKEFLSLIPQMITVSNSLGSEFIPVSLSLVHLFTAMSDNELNEDTYIKLLKYLYRNFCKQKPRHCTHVIFNRLIRMIDPTRQLLGFAHLSLPLVPHNNPLINIMKRSFSPARMRQVLINYSIPEERTNELLTFFHPNYVRFQNILSIISQLNCCRNQFKNNGE